MKTTFKEILKYYWPHIKKYKVPVFTAMGAYVVGSVVTSALIPLVYKRIIDITTSGVSDTTTHQLIIILFIFVALIIFRLLLLRAGDFLHTPTAGAYMDQKYYFNGFDNSKYLIYNQ